jgi:hypothetical protein
LSDYKSESEVLETLEENQKYILFQLSLDKMDFDKLTRIPHQIETIYDILNKQAIIAIDWNATKTEGIYVKAKGQIFKRFHLMASKKFLKQMYRYKIVRPPK